MKKMVITRRHSALVTLAIIVAMADVQPVSAISLTTPNDDWLGGSSLWASGSNWNDGAPSMTSATQAMEITPIRTGGPSAEPVLSTGSWDIASIFISDGSSLTQSAGSLTVQQYVQVGFSTNGAASYAISSAALTVTGVGTTPAEINIDSDSSFVQTGTSDVDLVDSNSILSIAADTTISGGAPYYSGSGTYTLDDSSSSFGLICGKIEVGNSIVSSTGALFNWEGGGINTSTIQLTNGGTFELSGGFADVNWAFSTNNGNIYLPTGNELEIGGVVSGDYLSVSGGGRLDLTADNSSSLFGGVTVNSGATLLIANAGALGANPATVESGGTLDLYGQTVSGGVVVNGAGVGGDGAIINSSGTAANWESDFDLDSNATIGGTGNITISGAIDGNYTLTKVGSNYLTLGYANTYFSGNVEIDGGRIAVTADDNLGTGSTLTMNGGVLEVDGSGFTLSRAVSLGAGGGAFLVPSGELTVSGIISGGGQLDIAGAGQVNLSSGNTYSGGTFILLGGTASIADDSALGYSTSPVALDGGTLQFTAATAVSDDRTLYVSSNIGTIDTNGHNVEIDSAITDEYVDDAGVLEKVGSGTLTLTGTNTYTGSTVIDAGTLAISSDNAVNAGGGGITFGGGILQFNNYPSSLTFDDVANLNLGAATGDASTLSNGISGSYGLTYSGPGTLILTGANTYAGDTAVSAGTLKYDITSGSVSVTDGATITIASSAAIIADGSVDPFSDASGHRVNIVNNSTITSGVGGFSVTAGSKSIGTLTGSGDTVVGDGAILDLASFQQNSITLNGSGILQVRKRTGSTPQVNTLSLLSIDYGDGATLKLRDNALVVNYGMNTDPISTIFTYIQNAFDGGYDDQSGLVSPYHIGGSLGYANVASEEIRDISGNWLGQSLASTTVAVVFTWFGDCNLDGIIDSTDLDLMGSAGPIDWYHGDLNYDGVVDADDYSLFELGATFYSFDGAWPNDRTPTDDAMIGGALLAEKEAEFSGETNDEIRSQLERQMGDDSTIMVVPEPVALSMVLLLPLLKAPRRRVARGTMN